MLGYLNEAQEAVGRARRIVEAGAK